MERRLHNLLEQWDREVKMRIDLVQKGMPDGTPLTEVQKVAMLAIAKVIQDKRVELRATMDGVPVPRLEPKKNLRMGSITVIGGRQ